MHGCPVQFMSREGIDDHMVKKHLHAQPHAGQCEAVAQMSASSQTSEPSRRCPFCGGEEESEKKLQSHIGRHQEDLALFAIPSSVYEKTESDNGNENMSGDEDLLFESDDGVDIITHDTEDLELNDEEDIGFDIEAGPQRCRSCNRSETPQWRRGPDGPRTLCNACGLREL